MKKIAGLAAAALMLAAPSAQAAVVSWSAALNGGQEVPPNASTGTGAASGELDTITGALSWTITFSGLTGPLTGMHFHGPAAPGANGGLQVDIGAISGLSSPSVGATIISSSQVTNLLADLFYINLHTATFGGGEIRGQVLVADVPAPLSAPLALSGLAALGLFARRRARG